MSDEQATRERTPLPITLEYSLGELRERSQARRAYVLQSAAPLISRHYRRLTELNTAGLEGVDEAVAAKALELYDATVADGRYVDLLQEDPRAAADRLGLDIPEDAISAIGRINRQIGGDVEGPVEAVIAVAVVIVLAPKIPADGIVVDELTVLRSRL